MTQQTIPSMKTLPDGGQSEMNSPTKSPNKDGKKRKHKDYKQRKKGNRKQKIQFLMELYDELQIGDRHIKVSKNLGSKWMKEKNYFSTVFKGVYPLNYQETVQQSQRQRGAPPLAQGGPLPPL